MKWFKVISVVLVVALVVTLVPVGRAYAALCEAPVSAFVPLAAARDQARSEVIAAERPAAARPDAAKPSGDQPAPSGPNPIQVVAARVRAFTLENVLAVKQSNQVAFPTHALTAVALEAGRCPAVATGGQWEKAAAHAWNDWLAGLTADGLARTAEPGIGRAEVVNQLRRYAGEEPWHGPNIERVIAIYQGRGDQ